MERDWCRDLESRSRHSRRLPRKLPRLAIDLSLFPVLLFECSVLRFILVSDLNHSGVYLSNHLEYHPEAPRGHGATTAWYQVEEVPLQATPEDPQSFLDNQGQVHGLCYVTIRFLLQFDSSNRFSQNYAMVAARGLRTFRV